jgi:SAM-dependent methyltransferase
MAEPMEIYMWRSGLKYLERHGLRQTAVRALQRARPSVAGLTRLAQCRLEGRQVLEVGGPTPIFEAGQLLPLYPVVGSLDNVNYSSCTVWEGTIEEGRTFRFDGDQRRGTQLVREATDLAGVSSERYDALISSHVIEHFANPLAGLREWLRVIRPGGALVLVVPHRDGTFDHKRPVTTLAHLVGDLEVGTAEDDLTHLEEVLANHDLSLDPGVAGRDSLRERAQNNFVNRCMHHHVFDTNLVAKVLDFAKTQILALEPRLPHHIIAVAAKPDGREPIDNRRFLGRSAGFRWLSPFPSDHRAAPKE